MAFSLSSTHFVPLSLSSLKIQNPNTNPNPHSLFFSKSQKTQFLKPYKTPFKLACTFSEPPQTTTYPDNNNNSDTTTFPEPNSESNEFPTSTTGFPPPLLKKRKRYRKEYPGESKGITEEMRFVAMKLRNTNYKGSRILKSSGDFRPLDEDNVDGADEAIWEPSLDGFVKYLVDSKLVFHTVERLVEDSNDVSYAYFRKIGLERSESLAKDLEWFKQQNMLIPEPSSPGVSYASYLKELSSKSGRLFLCHFYNIYFSHIAGGQVIAEQVVEKLLGKRELNFYKWDEDAEELLKDVREKLNTLSEHWPRDDKNKSLKEATKSFRYMGQIVRLIIL